MPKKLPRERRTIHVHVDANKITRVVEADEKRSAPNNLATVLWPLSPRYAEVLTNFSFPYVSHPVVFSALEAIMRNMKTVPLTIRKGARGSAEADASAVVQSGPWNDLFGRPCSYLSQKQWLHCVFVWYDQTGDVMLVAEGAGGKLAGPKEIPVALHPCNGKNFKPELNNVTGKLVGWRSASAIFNRWFFSPEEVVHFHRPDPRNPLQGIGVQEACAITTRSDVKAMIFDEKFLDNGCVFSGVITAENLTQDQVDQIRRQKEDEHGGYLKAFKLLALAGTGIKFTPSQQTAQDMQFHEKRIFSREEILMCRGVPESELGIGNDASIITGQGQQSSNAKMWTGAVLPLLAVYEQLFRRVDPATWLEWDRKQIQALQPNLTASITTGQQLLAMGYTLNEINVRLDWGMEAVEDGSGDIRYIGGGLTPIDALTLDDMPGAGEPAPEEPAAAEPEEEGEPAEEMPEMGKSIEALARANVVALELVEDRKLAPVEVVGARKIVGDFMTRKSKAREKVWRRVMKKVFLPMEARFRRAMGVYLYSLRREQMRRIAKLDVKRALEAMCALLPELGSGDAFLEIDSRDTIDQILFPTPEWNGKLNAATEPVYFDVIQRATDDVFGELGGNFAFDITDPRVIDIVSRRQETNLAQVNKTIRSQTARVIEKGVRDGNSITEIQESVRKQFDFTASRSLTIARTEVAGAANEARFDVMQEEGVEEHTWSTANDEAVRTSHAQQDGVAVRLGTPFPNGQEYPGHDIGDPGETVNCRCLSIPV